MKQPVVQKKTKTKIHTTIKQHPHMLKGIQILVRFEALNK
jgi:hypothetical protein